MKLIDADKLIEDIYSNAYACTNDEINKILHKQLETNINVINNQPTAFDVDKVISNIWDRSELIHIKHTHNDEIEDYIRTTDASEIVKAGGIDE